MTTAIMSKSLNAKRAAGHAALRVLSYKDIIDEGYVFRYKDMVVIRIPFLRWLEVTKMLLIYWRQHKLLVDSNNPNSQKKCYLCHCSCI